VTSFHLRSHTPETLRAAFPEAGLTDRLARKVARRLVALDHDDLAGVPGLSNTRRDALLHFGSRERLRVVDRRRSDVDSFVKYLFEAPDGRTFEAVRIPLDRPRWSACVSSQAGCALACAFCETGRLGLARNLEPWEIVEQVLTIRREAPERPLWSVVFQGQGEPLHNYEAVMRAAAILRDPCAGWIRGDRMTISTVGLLPEMRRYTDEGHPYRLMLSLHSAFGEKRAGLVPVGKAHDVRDLADAMRRHVARHGGPACLAWVLMGGVNDQPEEARELALLFRGVSVRLSVIDVNDTTGRFRRATDGERSRFFDALGAHGIAFHRRYSGGPDIHAACGMLRGLTPFPPGEKGSDPFSP
jgi:23S rRNA (adenine2503-C2)-methyltransferase